jgi:hypothetical protein
VSVSLKAVDQAAIAKAVAIVEQDDLGKALIAVRSTEATLVDVVAMVRQAVPQLAPVEVRATRDAHFTLDIQGVPAARVLQSLATLGGAKLYLFENRWLIAPEDQLTKDERAEGKEWARGVTGGGSTWSAQMEGRNILLKVIAAALDEWAPDHEKTTLHAANSLKLSFSQLSPELQALVQYVANWRGTGERIVPLPLTSSTTIVYDRSQPQLISFEIRADPQQAELVYKLRR